MDLAQRPSVTSQLSTYPLTPKPKDPLSFPRPPIKLFAATPGGEQGDKVLGKPAEGKSPQQLHKRHTSLPKVKVEPIRMPKRLPSASSASNIAQGNKPHPQLNPLTLKKSNSNADVTSPIGTPLTKPASLTKLTSPPPPLLRSASSQSQPPPVHSTNSTQPKPKPHRGKSEDPFEPSGPVRENLSSSSDGEVCYTWVVHVCSCVCAVPTAVPSPHRCSCQANLNGSKYIHVPAAFCNTHSHTHEHHTHTLPHTHTQGHPN